MRRLISFYLLCLLSTVMVWGEEKQIQYLFPEFQDGQILYKDGRSYNAKVNFSLVSNRFVFIDASDNNTIKEFGEPEKVGIVKTGDRIFMIGNKGEASEVMQQENPRVLVEYKGKLVDRGKKSAYGGRSQTSSIDSFSSFQSGGLRYQLEGDDRWIIKGIEKKYQVAYKGKLKSFLSFKQFLKIYPKKHTAALEAFIKDKKIDIDSVEQVIDLCNYANALD